MRATFSSIESSSFDTQAGLVVRFEETLVNDSRYITVGATTTVVSPRSARCFRAEVGPSISRRVFGGAMSRTYAST